MFRTRFVSYGLLGLLLCTSGCNFLRERLCCNRPGILTGRFSGTTTYPTEIAQGNCACEGTLVSGPIIGSPIVEGQGSGVTPILPNPNPIPRIQENPGRQGEYDPSNRMSRGLKGNETKGIKE